jgi:hypothetical protein
MKIIETEPHLLHITWQSPEASASLKADLRDHSFTVCQDDEVLMAFEY